MTALMKQALMFVKEIVFKYKKYIYKLRQTSLKFITHIYAKNNVLRIMPFFVLNR